MQCNIATPVDGGMKMINSGNMNPLAIPLVGVMLLVTTGSSVMMAGTDDADMNLDQIVIDTINWLIQLPKIENAYGEYTTVGGEQVIHRVVLHIRQYVRCPLDVSQLSVQLRNDRDILILPYSGACANSKESGIFLSTVWDQDVEGFHIITVMDKDNSVQNTSVINGDAVFICITLPESFYLHQDETMTVTIITGTGAMTSIVLEGPLYGGYNIISFRDP